MYFHKIKSYAKINLALNIIGKNSYLHKIESIVAFSNLHDIIYIRKIKSSNLLIIKYLLVVGFQKKLVKKTLFQNF